MEIQAAPPAVSRASIRVSSRSAGGYIVGAAYDSFFFLGAPLLALFLGVACSFTPLAVEDGWLQGHSESVMSLFSGAFTMAHLFAVFFRSHANPVIFRRHPIRFLAVPPVLFLSMFASSWLLLLGFVVAVWWDVYHSSLQTYGLGRLYDVRAGAECPDPIRRLDRGMNLLIYAGPVLAGASLMDHVTHFDKLGDFGPLLFTRIPAAASANALALRWAVLAFAPLFIARYFWVYAAYARAGGMVSGKKATLFALTGLTSVIAWGFAPFGQAFFIMNFFHALQYFALLWSAERGGIRRVFLADRAGLGRVGLLALFVGVCFAYGIWAKGWGESGRVAFSVLLTVSLLHFWYDGFIWSVSGKDVR